MVTLTKVQNPSNDSWLRAVRADYSVPRNAQVFCGWSHHGERVAVWVEADGGGFGAVDGDPDGYLALSRAIARDDQNFNSSHPGVDEYEFEPGTFDPAAETIELDARSSF